MQGLTRRRGGSDAPAASGGATSAPNPTSPAAAAATAATAAAGSAVAPATVAAASKDSTPLLERYEFLIPLLLLLLGVFTRFYRLDRPDGVVFDEFHFGRFTNQYHMGTYLFDIHPPLGKLVLYAASVVAGYDHSKCSYANIQDIYSPDCKYVWLRATAAAFGALTVPLIYLITRGFGAGVRGGILAALLFTFDGLNVAEARLILIDSQLIFWCAASLTVAQRWWREWNAHFLTQDALAAAPRGVDRAAVLAGLPDAFVLTPLRRVAWVLVIGFVCVNAVSVKFTGLATPGMIAVESFGALLLLRRSLPLVDLVGVAVVAITVFVSYYYVHFDLLPRTGDGDGFMSLEFQRTLLGSSFYDPNATRPPFLQLAYDLNTEMIRANARIEQRHSWDSVWWEWPLNLRGVLYYSRDIAWTFTEGVYLLANPIVSWIVLFCVLVSIVLFALFVRLRTYPELAFTEHARVFAGMAYCFTVYVLNLAPYMAVARSCFIYHYMPALMYGEILTALLLERLAGKRWMPVVLKVLAVVIIFSFAYFAPWIYAFPLTSEGHARRRWLRRWD